MRFITKKQTALVVLASSGSGLDIKILTPGTIVKKLGQDYTVPEDTINSEIGLQVSSELGESQADYNRWVNQCSNENQKFKSIALYDCKEGDVITVLVQYLAE